MREVAPGLRLMPSSAAAAARPCPNAPPSTAKPMASAAPSVAAACMSKELAAAPPACANALPGTRPTPRIPKMVASTRLFVLNMTSSSLLMRPKTALLLMRLVLRGEANVHASQHGEDQRLNDQHQATEQHEGQRHEHRDEPRKNTNDQVIHGHVQHEPHGQRQRPNQQRDRLDHKH